MGSRQLLRFATGRVVRAIGVLIGVLAIVFGLLELTGDPAAALLPPQTPLPDVALYRHTLGLDQPLPVQFVLFVARAAHGDFGISWRDNQPALALVAERLPATLLLAGLSLLLSMAVGLLGGTAAAVYQGRLMDILIRFLALIAQAVPPFWLGVALILLLAVRLNWLPSSGSGVSDPRALIMPALTLALQPGAVILRLVRATVLETLRQDWIRAARARGVSYQTTIRRHALRPALLPVLGYLSVQIGYLLGGTVVVETVFAYPGMGQLITQRLADRDLPVVLAAVTVIGLFVVGSSVVMDILLHVVDPRIGP